MIILILYITIFFFNLKFSFSLHILREIKTLSWTPKIVSNGQVSPGEKHGISGSTSELPN